ncbi:PIN domain-containing protein [Olleya sp. Bg11-27]|uniref:PIN domain-containing protein n=1 Tax=Olleya sp. Bg11-27 TaxID=2058135 RepID=UPI000C30B412|nr:PIN domain-containing protein [Olleya sp. Bg11-27]AUC75015.1 hypothetical protein CW732_04720 [Olleya sp. Bg11-27]
MSRYIFLDTNNWIYLSNGFNIYSSRHDELHLKVFDIIKKRVADGSLIFIINDIILEEWQRNKDQVENQIKEIKNKYKSYIAILNPIKDFINNPIEIEEINLLKNKLESSYNEKIKRHRKHIINVEFFLKNETVKINITDKNKIDSANLALEKKAPFIGDKKNSMADALLLFSALDYIYDTKKLDSPRIIEPNKTKSYFEESYFVSSNKGDFSSPNDKEKIHPDLEASLNRTETKFHYTLGKLINSLENQLLTEEEENVIEFVDDSMFCDVCDYHHYQSVDFHDYIEVFNPNKKVKNRNQLNLDFLDGEVINNYENHSPLERIRNAECSNCGAEFIECTCGELNHIEDYNSSFECVGGCGNIFKANADIDKKGMIHNIEYEIVEKCICKQCDRVFDEIDESNLCESCAEYERIAIEK